MFLPNELSYQDVQQQPLLLNVAYAQGLQYWAEKLNLPENPDFCLLARSITQLREMVEEHIVFTDWNIFQDLERVDPGAISQWPQTSSSGLGRMEPPLDNQPGEQNICFMEAHGNSPRRFEPPSQFPRSEARSSWGKIILHPLPQNASLGMCSSLAMTDVELTRHITPPDRTEEENWYALVITTSIRQLNLGTACFFLLPEGHCFTFACSFTISSFILILLIS